MLKKTLFILLPFLMACGSSTTSTSSSNDPNPSETEVPDGDLTTLTYALETRTASSTFDHEVSFPGTYEMPLYIDTDGTVSLQAKDLEPMILRVCKEGARIDDCDVEITDLAVTCADLIFDLCASEDAADCSEENNTTIYKGKVYSTGVLKMNNLDIRIRAFVVSGNSSKGAGIDPEDESSFTYLLEADVTTGKASSGDLIGLGTKISNKAVTLVAAGEIPAEVPEMGGASYFATFDGDFDVAPLDLLE